MKIEQVKISEIKPYKNNPRINRKTINKLKELISSGDVEFNVPIVIDKNKVIVKGHSRFTALKELGYDTIPAIYSDNIDEINNEDRLQDNIIQELSTWRTDELSIEIRENKINPQEYDMKLNELKYSDIPKEIIQEDIIKANERFLQGVKKEKDFIELICPFCGEEFMIDRGEIKQY